MAGFAFPPLEPTLRSLWPRIMAPGPQLARAFSADAASQEVLFILGPLLAVGAAALLGATGGVLVMAVAGLLGTVLFCTHRLLRAQERPAAAEGSHPSALRTRAVRTLVLAQVAAGLPIGVLTISAARLATLGGTPSLNGWALAVNAGGALTGALIVARFPVRVSPERALRVLLLVLAVLYLPTAAFGLTPAVWLVAASVAGLCLPPLLTQVFAITAHATPASALTEANGWVISAFSVGIGVGTALAGVLAGAGGTAGAAAAVVGASVVALAARRPLATPPPAAGRRTQNRGMNAGSSPSRSDRFVAAGSGATTSASSSDIRAVIRSAVRTPLLGQGDADDATVPLLRDPFDESALPARGRSGP